jgi:hypothetical protein
MMTYAIKIAIVSCIVLLEEKKPNKLPVQLFYTEKEGGRQAEREGDSTGHVASSIILHLSREW